MKRILSILLALALVASLGIVVFADGQDLSVTITADGKSANVMGDRTGLFARVALVLDNNGVSGLYVTQATINSDGTIVIPTFMVPGLTVTGINVALVPSLDDIISSTPTVQAMDFKKVGTTPAEPEPTVAPTEKPIEPPEIVVTPEPEPEPTVEPSDTHTLPTAADLDPARVVYVSNSGKIHSVNDCSGMKNYKTMTLAEAEEKGYDVFCHNCWADDVWQ